MSNIQRRLSKDSVISAQIKRMQADMKRREDEDKEQEAIINEEIVNKPKQKQPVRPKQIDEEKERELVRQKSIKKYGYDPSIKLSTIKKNDNIPIEEATFDEKQFANITPENNIIKDNLRSPIVCLFGYTKSGKTQILNDINPLNNGDNEHIKSTFISIETILTKTEQLNNKFKTKLVYSVPGIVFIDTPGHECFDNLRQKAQDLCDMIILVVNIITGLDKHTIDIVKSLIESNKPFVVALNKIDMIYGWKSTVDANTIIDSLKNQEKYVMMEFKERVKNITTQFNELSLNVDLYYNNKDFNTTISMIPISGITKEGIPDLLMYIVQLSQKLIYNNLIKNANVECSVLEVKNLHGKGITIEVMLRNGILVKGDKIMMCSIKGIPIVTHIKTILTSNNNNFMIHDKITGSITCIIVAPNMEEVIGGSKVFVIHPDDTDDVINKYKADVVKPIINLRKKLNIAGQGIYINTNALGNLEAIMQYFEYSDHKVDIGEIRIGTLRKKDITRAHAMQKSDEPILIAYGVNVEPEIREYAESLKVIIFEHENMYELFNMLDDYMSKKHNIDEKSIIEKVIFPCSLSILPNCVFNRKSPIIIGVTVKEGILKKGTPICIPSKNCMELGIVETIEKNNKQLEQALTNEEVCINIIQTEDLQQYEYGRHFKSDDLLCSKITRESINAIVLQYPEIVKQKEIFILIKKLKKELHII